MVYINGRGICRHLSVLNVTSIPLRKDLSIDERVGADVVSLVRPTGGLIV